MVNFCFRDSFTLVPGNAFNRLSMVLCPFDVGLLNGDCLCEFHDLFPKKSRISY